MENSCEFSHPLQYIMPVLWGNRIDYIWAKHVTFILELVFYYLLLTRSSPVLCMMPRVALVSGLQRMAKLRTAFRTRTSLFGAVKTLVESTFDVV
jgi:hypothetical protein